VAYLTAAAFRAGSLAWYTAGLVLSDSEAPTADITSAITNFSAQFDDWTNDHYESETLTLELDGDGTGRLVLPKRCTSVTTLKTRDPNGTLTTQSATAYRLVSSLESTGTRRRSTSAMDYVDVVSMGPGLASVTEGSYVFPCGSQTVQVAGAFGWLTTPERAKRAVAMLVYDHFKRRGDSLYRAQRWQTEGAAYDASLTTPSGLPEVDEIVADLRRDIDLMVA
jgi:hypothetical protein